MKKQIKLSTINHRSYFRAPFNYFEQLPDRIMARCKKEERTHSFLYILKPALSLAALFTGITLIAYFTVQFTDKLSNSSSHQQQNIAEAQYTKQYSSQEELIEAMNDRQEEARDNEQDHYIDYLLEENIDYGTLINELENKNKNQ